MAFSPHVKIQIGGSVYDATSGGQAVEEWSINLSAIRVGSAQDLDAYLDDVHVAASGLIARPTTKISNTVALEFVKVNEVDALGHQLPGPTRMWSDTSTFAARGGGGSTLHPLTTACKVTLDDGSRNRRAKGGFYLPRMAASVTAGGRWNATELQGILDSTSTFVNALGATAGYTVAIASKVDASLTPITRIRVGDVPDNISRRRDDLRESYLTGSIVP